MIVLFLDIGINKIWQFIVTKTVKSISSAIF